MQRTNTHTAHSVAETVSTADSASTEGSNDQARKAVQVEVDKTHLVLMKPNVSLKDFLDKLRLKHPLCRITYAWDEFHSFAVQCDDKAVERALVEDLKSSPDVAIFHRDQVARFA